MSGYLGDADEQALQQFVNESPWECSPVRRRLAHRAAATASASLPTTRSALALEVSA